MNKAWSICVFVALLVLGATSAAVAQSQAANGSIEGIVRDNTGAAIPGVTVTVTNLDTGASRVVTTNQEGVYRAQLLPLGGYQVAAELSGFKKFTQVGIPLSA